MSRDEILKEILFDPTIMGKYGINEKELNDIKSFRPGNKKIVDIISTIINENDNNRSSRQIYSTIKNIHKI